MHIQTFFFGSLQIIANFEQVCSILGWLVAESQHAEGSVDLQVWNLLLPDLFSPTLCPDMAGSLPDQQAGPIHTCETSGRRVSIASFHLWRSPATEQLYLLFHFLLAILTTSFFFSPQKRNFHSCLYLSPPCSSSEVSNGTSCFAATCIPRPCHAYQKIVGLGTSLVVQWLRRCASAAGGVGLIPGQVTKVKVLHAVWCSQKKKKKLVWPFESYSCSGGLAPMPGLCRSACSLLAAPFHEGHFAVLCTLSSQIVFLSCGQFSVFSEISFSFLVLSCC